MHGVAFNKVDDCVLAAVEAFEVETGIEVTQGLYPHIFAVETTEQANLLLRFVSTQCPQVGYNNNVVEEE